MNTFQMYLKLKICSIQSPDKKKKLKMESQK